MKDNMFSRAANIILSRYMYLVDDGEMMMGPMGGIFGQYHVLSTVYSYQPVTNQQAHTTNLRLFNY